MKKSVCWKKLVSFALTVGLLAGIMTVSVSAAVAFPDDMTKLSDKETTLAPGIVQNEVVMLDKNGRQVEVFIATADLGVETVGVQSSYVGAQCANHGMAKMSEQMEAAQKKYDDRGEQYTAVVGMNGSYYNMTTGQPTGAFWMEGVDGNGSNPNGHPFFAILKDGTAFIGEKGDYNTYKDQIYEAVGGNEILVRNGVKTYATEDNAKYPRSGVGITEDGKVIFINANGHQAPKSVGLTRYEMGQLFVELGCVTAIKMDEGGSATYVTKPQGSDKLVVTNTPSDGAERPVSAGIIMYSTAKGDGEFDTAVLTAEQEYVTPESSVVIDAVGADIVGGAAEIPDNITWKLVDSKYGTVSDGVFTSNGTVGEAVIQMVHKDKVVGETSVHVVIPKITFASTNTVVPYGKTIPLSVIATYESIPVALKAGDVSYSLSDAALGTIENGEFIACDASTGLTGGTLTATLKYGENVTAATALVFGKGSEIVMDFEDSESEDFTMRSYYYDRNGDSGATGPAGRQEMGEAWIVDKTTGKVRNGEKALAVNVDNSWGTAAGGYSVMLHFPPVDCTGATYVGMWMYIPVKEMSKISVYVHTKSTIESPDYAPSTSKTLFSYQGFKNASVTPVEDGWYYFRAPVSGFNQISAIRFSTTDSDNTIWNPYDDMVFYIDDITADFSDAVDDRENPVFSNIYISEAADSKVEMNGQTITQNTITVVAPAADNTTLINYTGLDTKSAKVYVDGKQLNKGVTCAADGTVMADGVTLSNGTHTFRFEIRDNAGNMGCIERQVVVNEADGDIYLEAPDTALVPLGSVQYFNLMAKNIEDVKSVTAVIDLDSISHWELKGMETAYGFEAEYSVNKDFNTATITISRTGDVEATGETVLAKLPVRTWEPLGWKTKHFIDLGVVSANPGQVDSYKMMTPYGMWYSDGTRMYRIEAQVVAGQVKFMDRSTDTFTSEEKHILTEMNRYRADGYYDANWNWIKEDPKTAVKEVRQDKWSNHIHIAGDAQSQEATCTEAGYTDRIFCVGCSCGSKENIYQATADVACKGHEGGCGSVIDWGTVVPAKGHTYSLTDGILKCSCGKTFTGVWTDGVEYKDGIAAEDGWNSSHTKYYENGKPLTGTHIMNNTVYVFSDDGIYDEAASDSYLGFVEYKGDLYYAQLGELVSGWQAAKNTVADENPDDYVFADEYVYHYFDPVTYKAVESGVYTIDNSDYEFENRVLINGAWVTEHDGTVRYYWAGNRVANGWKTIKGDTYYFWYGRAYTGLCEVRLTYNAREAEWHLFDESGVHLNIVDGIYNGHYYVKGIRQYGLGLITVDGSRYYLDGNGDLAVGEKYLESSWTGGKLPTGTYTFDETGKLIEKNGFLKENDELHYYINSVRQYGLGLITVNGDKYYINNSGVVATGEKYLQKSWTNGQLETGTYTFGEDGKLLLEEEEKNGFYTENGELHYYVDGNLQTGLGLVTIGEDKYYINNSGVVATGEKYLQKSWTNGQLATGIYVFAEDGKFIGPKVEEEKNGFYTENGELHYYVDGNLQTGLGLVTIGEDKYYVNNSGVVATGEKYLQKSWTNGQLATGIYVFAEDGKFIGAKVEEEKNGFYTENGELHYYVDGNLQTGLGLVTIGEDKYYINNSGVVATGEKYLQKSWTNGQLATGIYVFAEDGKFIGPKVEEEKNGFYTENGELHYYVDGNLQTGLGLVTIGEDKYYINNSGVVATGEKYLQKSWTNGQLATGIYVFAEDGKFIGPKA